MASSNEMFSTIYKHVRATGKCKNLNHSRFRYNNWTTEDGISAGFDSRTLTCVVNTNKLSIEKQVNSGKTLIVKGGSPELHELYKKVIFKPL